MRILLVVILIMIAGGCASTANTHVHEERHAEVVKRLGKLESYMGWLIAQYRDHQHPNGQNSLTGTTVVPQCSSSADCSSDSNCVCDFGSGVCACVAAFTN